MSELRNRIIGALIDYRDASPEEGESWESWHYAAFDMAMEKIAGLLDETCEQPSSGEGGLREERVDSAKGAAPVSSLGWTGCKCPYCNGSGEEEYDGRPGPCQHCGGTGDEWGPVSATTPAQEPTR